MGATAQAHVGDIEIIGIGGFKRVQDILRTGIADGASCILHAETEMLRAVRGLKCIREGIPPP